MALVALVAPVASLGPGRAAPQLPSLSIDDPTLTVGVEGPAAMEFTVTLSGVPEPTTTTQPATTTTTQPATTTTTQPAALPATGSSVAPIVLVAATLIVAGLAAFALRRVISPPLVILLICAAAAAAAVLGGSPAHAQQPQPVVTVQFHTEDGTATAPEDYTATSGEIGFASGQTTATIVVQVSPQFDDSGKTFTVVLTDPVGATISKAVGTATVIVEAPTTTTTFAGTTTTPEPTTTSTTEPTSTSSTTSTTSTTTSSTTTSTTTSSTTTTTTAPPTGADLAVTLDAPTQVLAGQVGVQYLVTVSNNGPDPAIPVTLTFTVGPGLTPTAAAGAGWVCSVAGPTVGCFRDVVAPGPSPPVTVTVNVAPNPPSSVSSTATVASSTPDSNGGNNTASVTTLVSPG